VFHMDNFEIIIGKEFLSRTHLVLFPWVDKLVILGEKRAWVMHTTAMKPSGRV
jgi:hypothetical protein